MKRMKQIQAIIIQTLRRWLAHDWVFLVLNTAFWLGFGYLLLSSQVRLVVGGGLLALALGVYLLYGGISPKITRGMVEPGLARGLSVGAGLFSTALGLGMLLWFLSGGVPTQRQIIQQRIAQAARGSTRLDLSDLGLRHVPPEVWELASLQELDLSGNRLRALPPEIARLQQLEELLVWHNRLEALPPEIGTLSQLRWLLLGDNRLQTLPSELARLEQLTHLQLQYNRFRSFPAVLLELPNLELLWLSGNRMGELPAALTQCAAAGELSLVYKPNASPVDWASLLVIGLCFVFPVAGSRGLSCLWARYEQRQRQAAQQEGRVFPIPPFLRDPALFALLGAGAIVLFMIPVGLNAETTGVSPGAWWLFPLLFGPIMLGMAALLWPNTGLILLTAEGVAVRRWGRERFLRYDAIAGMRDGFGVPPALHLRGAGQILSIPRTVENYAELYALLLARIPTATREAVLRKPVPPPAPVSAPAASAGPLYTFGISRRVWTWYIVGTVLFVLLYLGLGLVGLWVPLLQGDERVFTWPWLRNVLLFFLMLSALFLPATIWIIRSFFTPYGPFKIKQPSLIELYRDKIRYRFPRGGWRERPATALRQAQLSPLPTKVRVRVQGGGVIEQTVTLYFLTLAFDDGEQLIIGQERATQFGVSPEQLHVILKQLYGRG